MSDDWGHIETLTDSSHWIQDVDFSDSGEYLISASVSNETAYVYETESWENIAELSGSDSGRTVAISNEFALFGTQQSVLHVYETGNWNEITTITNPTGTVYGCDISPNNEYIAVTAFDNDIYLYDTDDWGNPVATESMGDSGYDVQLSAEYVVVGYSGGAMIYTVPELDEVANLGSDSSYGVDLSDNGEYVAIGYDTWDDYRVEIYEFGNWGSPIETLPDVSSTPRRPRFSPGSQYLGVGDEDDNVYIYGVDDWDLVETITDPGSSVTGVDFSENYFVVGDEDNDVTVYNAPIGIELSGTAKRQGDPVEGAEIIIIDDDGDELVTKVESDSDGNWNADAPMSTIHVVAQYTDDDGNVYNAESYPYVEEE